MERRASSSSKRGASPAAPKVVAVLAGLLERAAKRGDDADHGSAGSGAAAAFRSPGGRKPEIGVRRYAERIYRYAGCSPACFVVAYAYLDRLALGEDEEGVAVDSYSVHRLLITSVMVAAKFMDDIHYNNAYFARVGGVEVAEMNGLELEFLFALRFRLNVTPDEFAAYCATLEGQMSTTTAPTPTPLSPTTPLLMSTPEEEERSSQQHRKVDAVAASITTSFTAARIPVAEITQQ